MAFAGVFLLGWGLGAALTFLVRALSGALLPDPCAGHTALALLCPLLLGPGGMALTARSALRANPRGAALGLGLVVSSLLPALYVGAQDIAGLRRVGCAGGYVVFAPRGGESVSSVAVPRGGQTALTLRIGGYTPQTHPGAFALRAESSTPGVRVALAQPTARAGETVGMTVSVAPDAPVNTYTVGVQATQRRDGQTYVADASLDVTVRPVAKP